MSHARIIFGEAVFTLLPPRYRHAPHALADIKDWQYLLAFPAVAAAYAVSSVESSWNETTGRGQDFNRLEHQQRGQSAACGEFSKEATSSLVFPITPYTSHRFPFGASLEKKVAHAPKITGACCKRCSLFFPPPRASFTSFALDMAGRDRLVTWSWRVFFQVISLGSWYGCKKSLPLIKSLGFASHPCIEYMGHREEPMHQYVRSREGTSRKKFELEKYGIEPTVTGHKTAAGREDS